MMKKNLIALFLILLGGTAKAADFQTKAQSAFLIDYDSLQIILTIGFAFLSLQTVYNKNIKNRC